MNLIAAVAAVSLLFAPSVAAAKGAKKSASKEEQAFALYEKGDQLYRDGKYEEALSAFRDAYKLEPAPGLLVNMGQCFRKLNNPELAINAFEHYLAAEPQADNRAEIEELLAEQRALLEPKPEAAPEPEPAPEPAAAAEPEPAPAAAPADEGGGEGFFTGPVLWGAIGGGALLVALAAGGTIAAVAVASQPAPSEPVEPKGSLGTVDFRKE
jgi:tetratricopeptide (TPR) repeat protein